MNSILNPKVAFKAYKRQLTCNPLRTKMLTSFTLFTMGDSSGLLGLGLTGCGGVGFGLGATSLSPCDYLTKPPPELIVSFKTPLTRSGYFKVCAALF